MEKKRLRQHYRALRQAIPAVERNDAARQAAENLVQQSVFKKAIHIACYLPTMHEFDVLPIMNACWQMQKKCYVPVVQANQTLRFVLYADGDSLKPNQFAILEPVDITKAKSAAELDMVILPLLAFDRNGHRLGAGGGFYDRTFAKVHGPKLVGVGYAKQEVTALPADPWDLQLSNVLTEKEFITCGPQARDTL